MADSATNAAKELKAAEYIASTMNSAAIALWCKLFCEALVDEWLDETPIDPNKKFVMPISLSGSKEGQQAP